MMAHKYRRGFKTESEAYSLEYRKELKLQSHDPLCPWQLARLLEIPVEPLSQYRKREPRAVKEFMEENPESFSAVTIFDGYRALIIHNDSHSDCRQAANIIHELSHCILGHKPTPVVNEHGCRHFNEEEENEANWLGPALLISKDAAFHTVKTGMSYFDVSKTYRVSRELYTMRLNATGVRKIIARSMAKKQLWG
jgi:Zn-dependent peptidase ImmA (M78 family)